MADIGIGRLAEVSGVKVPTIRFYEQSGLVQPLRRSEGGQRRYDDSAVQRLRFIRHARDLGFDVEDIRQLLALSDHPALPCDGATKIARHHLELVESKIVRLNAARRELKRMIAECGDRSVADCRILDAIARDVVVGKKLNQKPAAARRR
jgi:DNA-binding transcriptional MerR regulator